MDVGIHGLYAFSHTSIKSNIFLYLFCYNHPVLYNAASAGEKLGRKIMKQIFQGTVYCIVVLAASLSLSGCASISQTVGAVSHLNPFQQQAEETPTTTAPAGETPPVAPAANIRVEKQPPAVAPKAISPAVPKTAAKPPASKKKRASSATRVSKKKKPASATAKSSKELEVNLGNNKECTTFCALPLRKPPTAP